MANKNSWKHLHIDQRDQLSFSKRVLLPFLSNENEISFTYNLNYFYMHGYATGLDVIKRLRVQMYMYLGNGLLKLAKVY